MTDEYNIYERELPDGRAVFVHLLTFGRARIIIGPAQADWYDDSW